MSIEEYHATVDCKVAGTWNVHNALVGKDMRVDFFTMFGWLRPPYWLVVLELVES
jgi:hypothetical protein